MDGSIRPLPAFHNPLENGTADRRRIRVAKTMDVLSTPFGSDYLFGVLWPVFGSTFKFSCSSSATSKTNSLNISSTVQNFRETVS